MLLLEEYKELIERDSKEISFLWKIVQISGYFLSAISGYCSSIIFYIFWEDIFGGRCPLWAHVYALSTRTVINSNNDDEQNETNIELQNWLNNIAVRYDYEKNCEIYFYMSLFSCIFGIMWIAMFSVYVTSFTTYDLQKGYEKFTFDMQKVFSELTKSNKLSKDMICNILQSYVEMYDVHGYNICNVFFIIQILGWTIAGSWIFNLMLLVIRILLITDFRILRVRVYEIPYNSIIPSLANDKNNIKTEPSESEKKKKD
ncbi:hypothetical protein HZH66_013813 [Vespula vulgaris]|uniref:Uncharacterized protein n=1 Tax=Vespula vulgaris TaxID=7454 RepID=A0A834J6M4_VESVU|nr:hypothetical protein HZH66_013813 [Vespula vulgaris]